MGDREIDFREWHDCWRKEIARDTHSADSMGRLINAGCSEIVIKSMLHACVQPEPAMPWLEPLKSVALRRKVGQLADALIKAVGICEEIESRSKLLWNQLKSIDTSVLRSYAESARAGERAIESFIGSNDGFPDLHLMALARLVEFVQKSTGKPHYREIANLLQTAFLAQGVAITPTWVTEDGIRKRIERLKKLAPEIGEMIKHSLSEMRFQTTEAVGEDSLQDNPEGSAPGS